MVDTGLQPDSPTGAFATATAAREPRPGLARVLVGYWMAFALLQLAASALSTKDGIALWYFPAALSLALLLDYGPKVLPAIILAPLLVLLLEWLHITF